MEERRKSLSWRIKDVNIVSKTMETMPFLEESE